MTRAVVTARTSQSFWHPLFDAYYGQYVDHIEVLPIPDEIKDNHHAITQRYNVALPRLLRHYDYVLPVDCDEILLPDPEKYGHLGDYLDKATADAIKCVGYNVIQRDGQPPIDINEPITEQRTYWQRDPLYDKIVVTRLPIFYYPGRHKSRANPPQDEDLIMLHLRDADLTSLFERHPTADRAELAQRQEQARRMPRKWRMI